MFSHQISHKSILVGKLAVFQWEEYMQCICKLPHLLHNSLRSTNIIEIHAGNNNKYENVHPLSRASLMLLLLNTYISYLFSYSSAMECLSLRFCTISFAKQSQCHGKTLPYKQTLFLFFCFTVKYIIINSRMQMVNVFELPKLSWDFKKAFEFQRFSPQL